MKSKTSNLETMIYAKICSYSLMLREKKKKTRTFDKSDHNDKKRKPFFCYFP